jgi:transcriptional antiterminator RfaH
MPLLPLEPFVCPDNLFDQPAAPEQDIGRWWVLHTRPRAEKALARILLGRKLRFFLPLYQKQLRSSGRCLNSYLPLFSGYIFLHGDSHDRLHALETNLVAQVLPVENQLQIHRDLMRVHDLMIMGACLSPEERLQPGMLVEIVRGPLIGMQGKIVTRHNKMRFLVEVQFLQQGVSLDIESWMIQRVSLPPPVLAGA